MVPSVFISTNPDALLKLLPKDTPRRNTFTGLVFLLTTGGEAIVGIDEHTYTLRTGTLLTLLPLHLLSTTLQKEEHRCLTLAFMFDAMTDFPYMLQSVISEKMEHTPVIRLTEEEMVRLENLHKNVADHYIRNTHPAYQEILRSFLFIYTAEVCAIYSGKPAKSSFTHNEELTGSFFRLLHQYFRTNREATFYADRLCLSSKYLSRVIRQVTGQVPSYWIADFTVREAKTLLKSTTLTVTQISEELNFPNSSFFARYFKRLAGVSPQEYRSGRQD